MIVRYLTRDDAEESAKVSSSAFIWKVDFEQDIKEGIEKFEKLSDERIMGAFLDDNKTLMAQIEVIDFKTWFYGKLVKSNGIGGVSSKPEYRRGGAVRAIFNEFLKRTKEEGYALSILYPFSYDYYRKFGYEMPNRYVSCTIPFAAINYIERNNDVILYEGQCPEKLLGIYNEYASRHNLMFARTNDDKFYKEPYRNNEYTYIWCDKNGTARSYASFNCDRSTSSINVREILYSDYESLYGILGYLRIYDGNFEQINFGKIPQSSSLLEMFTECKYCKNTLNNGGSWRIQDIEAILNANEYPAEKGDFTLRYSEDCVHGDCIFNIEYENKTAKVTLIAENITGENQHKYDVSMNASAAAKLLLGGIQNELSLQFIKGVEIKGSVADLIRAFPVRPVDYYEGF